MPTFIVRGLWVVLQAFGGIQSIASTSQKTDQGGVAYRWRMWKGWSRDLCSPLLSEAAVEPHCSLLARRPVVTIRYAANIVGFAEIADISGWIEPASEDLKLRSATLQITDA